MVSDVRHHINTPPSPSCLRDGRWLKEGQKTCESWSTGRSGVERWPPGTTRLLHPWTHSSCDYPHKPCLRSAAKYSSIGEGKGFRRSHSSANGLLTADDFWGREAHWWISPFPSGWPHTHVHMSGTNCGIKIIIMRGRPEIGTERSWWGERAADMINTVYM